MNRGSGFEMPAAGLWPCELDSLRVVIVRFGDALLGDVEVVRIGLLLA